MNWFYVFIGGGLGSLLRYSISLYFARFAFQFPVATFISNLFATSLVALVTFIIVKKVDASWIQPLVIIGFCGGFSTFSTFSLETVNLFQSGNFSLALLNVVLSILICFGIVLILNK